MFQKAKLSFYTLPFITYRTIWEDFIDPVLSKFLKTWLTRRGPKKYRSSIKGNGTEKMPAGASGTKLGQMCVEMEGGT